MQEASTLFNPRAPGVEVHAQPEVVVSCGERVASLELEGFGPLGDGVEDGDGPPVGLLRVRGEVGSGAGVENPGLRDVGDGGGSGHGEGHSLQDLAGFRNGHLDLHDGLAVRARIKDGVRLFTGCCGGSRVQGGSAGQAQGQGAHAGFKGTVHVLLRDGGC